MDIWLLCYDISDDKRRNRVSSWLLRFGMRVQESVFEVSLKNAPHFNRLWAGLQDRLGEGDSVRAYPMSQQTLRDVRCLGSAAPLPPAYALVL
jgi:CRISPR-associated protein Cas2